MKFSLFVFLSAIASSVSSAQQLSYTDPAQQYNRLLIENNNGKYYQIQNFKVVGTPYLYGGSSDGVVYTPASSIGKVNYNTYNQQVEISTAEGKAPNILDVKSVDSFVIKINTDQYKGELKFINASRWDNKNKFFVQEVIKTSQYTLYKKFVSTLEVVTTNYIQSELRQFQLNYEYYYSNNAKSELKKLKVSENALKNEFIDKKDCITNIDFTQLSANKENILKIFFQTMDSCK